MGDWRRKPQVKYLGIETSGAVFVDTPTARWSLEGEHAAEDLARVLAGCICVRCWTPYPEPPSLASARRILDQIQNWGRGRAEVKQLLAQGRCGVCSAEVSPEMASLFFEGEIIAENRSAPGDPNQHEMQGLTHLVEGGMNRKRGARAS